MIPIISFLLILCTSLLVTRIATVALTLTGMPRETARFQARSAFSGSGFTTSESEQVVNHPVRRNIVRQLMLWGNIGIVTVISSLMLSLLHSKGWESHHWFLFGGGILGFYFLAVSKSVEKGMTRLIAFYLRRYTNIETRDYVSLLHLGDGYGVQRVELDGTNPLVGLTIDQIRQAYPHMIILGVLQDDGTYLGAPSLSYATQTEDRLVVYGSRDGIESLRGCRANGSSDSEVKEDASAESLSAVGCGDF